MSLSHGMIRFRLACNWQLRQVHVQEGEEGLSVWLELLPSLLLCLLLKRSRFRFIRLLSCYKSTHQLICQAVWSYYNRYKVQGTLTRKYLYTGTTLGKNSYINRYPIFAYIISSCTCFLNSSGACEKTEHIT